MFRWMALCRTGNIGALNDSVWNAVAFGNPLYAHPKQMIDSVHILNAHIIILSGHHLARRRPY